jgi:hypothetical protein
MVFSFQLQSGKLMERPFGRENLMKRPFGRGKVKRLPGPEAAGASFSCGGAALAKRSSSKKIAGRIGPEKDP